MPKTPSRHSSDDLQLVCSEKNVWSEQMIMAFVENLSCGCTKRDLIHSGLPTWSLLFFVKWLSPKNRQVVEKIKDYVRAPWRQHADLCE